MRNEVQKILALLVCVVLTLPMWAQRNTPFGLIDSSFGLSNNFILSLAIDGQGFVWVGTESGLNRVAAGTCLNYKCTPPYGKGRGNSNRINTLYYDPSADLMFVGTESGLNILEPRSGIFVKPEKGDSLVNYSIEDITPGGGSLLWLVYANGQLQQIDTKTLTVTTRPINNKGGCRCALDDGTGRLYLGYNKGGMRIVDIETGHIISQYIHYPGQAHSIPGDNVRRVMRDSRHRIWVGTDHGLALYDAKNGIFHKVTHSDMPFDDNVFDMCEMADGRLWIACDVGGVSVLSAVDHPAADRLVFDEGTPAALSSLNSRALVQDKFGNVWVGNHSTGVDFIASHEPPLRILPYYGEQGRFRDIHAIAHDAQGHLWVNGGDYLSHWERGQLTGEWRIKGMQGRAHSFARSMMADSRGNIWLGMEDEGVIRFDTHTHQFQYIDIGYDAPDIHAFHEDRDGRIWIGSQLGVCTYYDGRVTPEPQIDRLTRNAPVTSFLRLSDDELLMTTQGNGVIIYNQHTGDSQTFSLPQGLPTPNVNQAISDGKQGVWLATTAGIVHLDLRRYSLTVLDSSQGLTDTHIQAIATDSYGRLWASTYTGIVCYYPDTKTFHHYSGYRQSASGFSAGAVATTAGGNIAFGSSIGVFYLNPDGTDWISDIAHPQIVACDVYYPTDEEMGTFSVVPDDDGRIELSHRQNTLRILVTHDNYAHRGHVDFSYKMKGIDDKWYDVGSDQEVVFRSLSPGHYTFVVRAKLRSQDWSDDNIQQLSIVIHPPFWQTWWAWLIYAGIAIAWIVYTLRSYKRRVALRSSLEMQQHENVQKQQLNEERLRFFTNITHELRTPLTLILGPLDDLVNDPQLPQAYRHRVSTIQKSALRLHDLINEILEFRKTETQNRRLTVARGDLGTLVHEIVLNYRELNRNRQVLIVDHIQPQLPMVYFDSEVISTIMSNFLSNAMKYTERGSISVSVAADTSEIAIRVSDTGYGIAPEALPHIFDRYYQAKGSHQASGTGIGLALVKSLADLHQGTLTVDSQEGRGSCFTFKLCIDNTYPDALHKEDEKTAPETSSAAQKETVDGNSGDEQPMLLVVEDNDDIRQYVADSLGDDFHILQAANGEEGAQVALQQIPDLIISDIMMPKMDGIALTRLLKNDIRTSHIPMILLTAKDTIEDKETGYDSGADSYLTKPFTAKLLVSRIRNIMANRRRMAEQMTSATVSTSPALCAFPAATTAPGGFPAETTVLGGSAAETTVLSGSAAETTAPPASAAPGLSPLDHEFIQRLNTVISDHIMQEDIDMAFLTDKMAMSHSTFYRKVKALTGMTAKEYVRRQRLNHCYRLLESGDYNVNEAAMMTGFNQMAHFREVFKKEFGILPSEVIRKSK